MTRLTPEEDAALVPRATMERDIQHALRDAMTPNQQNNSAFLSKGYSTTLPAGGRRRQVTSWSATMDGDDVVTVRVIQRGRETWRETHRISPSGETTLISEIRT